jgi:hypothetical protein
MQNLTPDTAEPKSLEQQALEDAEAKLAELRAIDADPESLMILKDPGGPFAGVFRLPSPEVWEITRAELRNEQSRIVADENLVNRCLVWPDKATVKAARRRRAALYQILSSKLTELTGARDEAIVKK